MDGRHFPPSANYLHTQAHLVDSCYIDVLALQSIQGKVKQ